MSLCVHVHRSFIIHTIHVHAMPWTSPMWLLISMYKYFMSVPWYIWDITVKWRDMYQDTNTGKSLNHVVNDPLKHILFIDHTYTMAWHEFIYFIRQLIGVIYRRSAYVVSRKQVSRFVVGMKEFMSDAWMIYYTHLELWTWSNISCRYLKAVTFCYTWAVSILSLTGKHVSANIPVTLYFTRAYRLSCELSATCASCFFLVSSTSAVSLLIASASSCLSFIAWSTLAVSEFCLVVSSSTSPVNWLSFCTSTARSSINEFI